MEENTKLNEKVKTYQNIEIQNKRMQDKYKEVLKVKKVSRDSQTEHNTNDENIGDIVNNKYLGYSRTTPSSSTSSVKTSAKSSNVFICNLCTYRTNNEEELKKHVDIKHCKCDLCMEVLNTPVALRDHLRIVHNKQGGTLSECTLCKFSALNKRHLDLHMKRHHSELNCNSCDFKTRMLHVMNEHKATNHKINFTCKFWRQNTCNKDTCQFKHEIISCKFGNNCRNNNCQFGHQQQNCTRSQNNNKIYHWINPAFVRKESYNNHFPFLGNSSLQYPMRGQGRA